LNRMKILLTGASSFTGTWFAHELSLAGHQLVCPLRQSPERYEGIRKRRMEALPPSCKIVPNAPFGSPDFFALLGEGIDLLCHHGAEMTNYRSPDFDPQAALQKNAFNLPQVLAEAKTSGCQGVVLTGSVFESDEGAGTMPLRAFSPYGLSKALTFQVFRHYCRSAGLALGKFVIPNPFGPMEEERFTAYLCRSWREGKTPVVKTPDYVRDNIPSDLLAKAYVRFCERVASGKEEFAKANPSGYIESQGAFATRVAREMRSRTNWACELDLADQADFSEPLVRVNYEPAKNIFADWDEEKFWGMFAGFYRKD
jgi:UDP-glucose 4-epimerase